ncbi:MAG: hypothetical protein R3F39_03875 [Myxococcota bacterium]
MSLSAKMRKPVEPAGSARWEIASFWDGRPLPAGERATVRAGFVDGAFRVEVDAPYGGDPAPSTPPGPTPRLWEHEVVELFVLGEADQYTEIELGPHGHHLVLRLAGRRQIVAEGLPLRYESRVADGRFYGMAWLDLGLLPPGPHRANACAIRGVGDARRYMSAWPMPGEGPDFHRLERFEPVDFGLGEEP